MGGPCLVDGVAREELDNFLPCRFVCRGTTWTSAEHCFQAAKFPHDPVHAERVRNAASGGDAFTMSNDRAVLCRADWEHVKVAAMYEANLAKFEQNAELRKVLMSSQGPITAFGFPFWAKWNAVLLERIREELRPESERDEVTLAVRVAAMDAVAAGKSIDPRPKGFGGTGKACAAAGGVPFPPELLQSLNKAEPRGVSSDNSPAVSTAPSRAAPAREPPPQQLSVIERLIVSVLRNPQSSQQQQVCAACGVGGGGGGESFCRACGKAYARPRMWRDDMHEMYQGSQVSP
uniref:NADAR domain-containing protein n=1 Tax=Coccolithus braarudii TaxID=221442 RepID=A0A7S0LH86_9EUKA